MSPVCQVDCMFCFSVVLWFCLRAFLPALCKKYSISRWWKYFLMGFLVSFESLVFYIWSDPSWISSCVLYEIRILIHFFSTNTLILQAPLNWKVDLPLFYFLETFIVHQDSICLDLYMITLLHWSNLYFSVLMWLSLFIPFPYYLLQF